MNISKEQLAVMSPEDRAMAEQLIGELERRQSAKATSGARGEGFLPKVGNVIQALPGALALGMRASGNEDIPVAATGLLPSRVSSRLLSSQATNEPVPEGFVSYGGKLYRKTSEEVAKPKLVTVGGKVMQIDPATGESKTIVESQPSELEKLQLEKARQEVEGKERKVEQDRIAREQSIEKIRTSAQDRLNTISEIKKGMDFFGPYGKLPSQVTSLGGLDEEAYNKRKSWENSINQLLAQLGFDMMVELKNASRTGATGLGSLTEKEGEWLRQASTQLTRDLPEDRAMEILSEMERLHKKVLGEGLVESEPGEVSDERGQAMQVLMSKGYTQEEAERMLGD